MTFTKYLNIIFFILVLNQVVFSFDKNNLQDNYSSTPNFVFDKIIDGINKGSVLEFSEYLSSQVYISLNTGEKGYYSKNQIVYILQNYFNIYKPSNFRITSRLFNSTNPYFAGKFTYSQRGKIGNVQVYIGLSLVDNRWEITQLTFN